ncbi:putative transcription factor B3-Domain family [Helianthus annuus]|nr:putative transcription factor B3-Domain family [Helianthus annuus]KAJ0632754.1 putative transcription factor B3-Domain family [Helianthus annuus]KAJ0826694.1 putative transcription factor B3-Domain family [Helianthus annuus]
MDPTKMAPSFLTFIGEEPIFLVCFFPFVTIPSDFATNLWGDKVPYGKTVQIRDGDTLRFVRVRKRNGEPIFTDGWIMLVRDNVLKLKDGILIKATGPSTFDVSCFKEYVCENSYFTTQLNIVPGMFLMPEKFWNDFYGKYYKDEMARVPLKNEPHLVFTRIDSKTFEIPVFDPDTGTEVSFKKVDVDKGKSKVDVGQVLITKNENPTKRTLRSRTIVAAEKQCYDRRAKVQKVNAKPSIASLVLNFTRVAEHKIRLPTDVSSVLDLSPGNLKEVRVQNLRGEVKKFMTRSEKHGKWFRYGLVGWSAYLKACKISFGVELFFGFHKSSKLLIFSKVAHKVRKKVLCMNVGNGYCGCYYYKQYAVVFVVGLLSARWY